MDLNEEDRCCECLSHVSEALEKTIAESRAGLAQKFNISEGLVRDTIAWAATNIAVEEFLNDSAGFDEEQRRSMRTHIRYLFSGARHMGQ